MHRKGKHRVTLHNEELGKKANDPLRCKLLKNYRQILFSETSIVAIY